MSKKTDFEMSKKPILRFQKNPILRCQKNPILRFKKKQIFVFACTFVSFPCEGLDGILSIQNPSLAAPGFFKIHL